MWISLTSICLQETKEKLYNCKHRYEKRKKKLELNAKTLKLVNVDINCRSEKGERQFEKEKLFHGTIDTSVSIEYGFSERTSASKPGSTVLREDD
jgi:hypothetical protein